MPAKRATGVPLPDPFTLEQATLDWLEKRYSQVDPELACERYVFWAVDFLYANHQRAFQNWVTREADNNRLGVMLKRVKTKLDGDMWSALEAEGLRIGFRKRVGQESVEQFKAALEAHKQRNANKVTDLIRSSLKAVG